VADIICPVCATEYDPARRECPGCGDPPEHVYSDTCDCVLCCASRRADVTRAFRAYNAPTPEELQQQQQLCANLSRLERKRQSQARRKERLLAYKHKQRDRAEFRKAESIARAQRRRLSKTYPCPSSV
jgi:hypothetical protein